MTHDKRLVSVVLAALLALVVAAPVSATQSNPGAYTSTEVFLGFIDFGTTTTDASGVTRVEDQVVLYQKLASDKRMAGIDIITFDAKFSPAGEGISRGTRQVLTGSVAAVPFCDVARKGCYRVFDLSGNAYYWQLKSTAALCQWEGRFITELAQFGQVAPSSYALLVGGGVACRHLLAIEDAEFGNISGEIRNVLAFQWPRGADDTMDPDAILEPESVDGGLTDEPGAGEISPD
jgi:hypothetical protein